MACKSSDFFICTITKQFNNCSVVFSKKIFRFVAQNDTFAFFFIRATLKKCGTYENKEGNTCPSEPKAKNLRDAKKKAVVLGQPLCINFYLAFLS